MAVTAPVIYKIATRWLLKGIYSVSASLAGAFGLLHFLSENGYGDAVIPAGSYVLASAVLAFSAMVLVAAVAACAGAISKTPLRTVNGGMRGFRYIARSRLHKAQNMLVPVERFIRGLS